jgi:hypothetical protein
MTVIRREISDSRLVIPNRSWEQQNQPFRREKKDTMLMMPKRRRKQQHAVIASKRKEEDEQHKHKNSIVTLDSKIISESLQVVSWNDETNNRGAKSTMLVLELALSDLSPKIPITRSGGYRQKETASRKA